jgi:acylphosphatase
MPTVRLLIKGKVQGVFYRASAKEQADALGVTGWVRNTREGAVEVVASGSTEAVDQFVRWCRTGPKSAKVLMVDVQVMPDQSFHSFKITRG